MSALTNHRREGVLPGLWHDYANRFPMLDAAAQDALRADVQEYGVREPVILFGGRILDGRNRYMAARDLGQDFPVADFEGAEAEALSYVLSTNLHRRHLTESQRAAVAAKLANMKPGNPDFSNSANLPDSAPALSQAQAADMLNVSERSVRTAKAVIEQGAPELVAAVEKGEVSVSAAASVAELPPDEQAAVVAAGPKAVREKAKEVRQGKQAASVEEQGEPEQIDPEVEKVMRKHAGLTREALLRDYAELVVASKAERAALKSEIEALKSQIALFEAEGDIGRKLGMAVRENETLKGRISEHMQIAKREEYKRKKAEERVAELERMDIAI